MQKLQPSSRAVIFEILRFIVPIFIEEIRKRIEKAPLPAKDEKAT